MSTHFAKDHFTWAHYPAKDHNASDIVAVMDLCVTPCMHDIDRRH